MNPLPTLSLGRSDLRVTPICLGTMTFGEQVDERNAHAILDHALERGINFIDTAEMYSVPARRETYGATERIIGNWFAARPGARGKVVLATKVAGPSRNMDWVRKGSANLTAADIVQACDDSLARLKTDHIDLYQIHWPNRNVPMFGAFYFEPAKDREVSSVHEQLVEGGPPEPGGAKPRAEPFAEQLRLGRAIAAGDLRGAEYDLFRGRAYRLR